MLMFTRDKGEAFYIGDNVKVTVAETKNGRCKLIVNAPKRIKVLREEVAERDAIEVQSHSKT
ncbi:carbon storage regulator [Halopseudomonas laoshanensis]|uniref:carbon storage regulator n=1 Tax=Halopseudomonas laoshanensis TaxID=2268758 RepID=UPI00373548F7